MSRTLRYLRYAVHGETEHPRRAPRRQHVSRGPARDWRYRAWVRTLPCAACGSAHQVEAAHTGSDGGTALKASDYSCIPLCFDCHQGAPGAYHRDCREAFEAWCGFSCEDLVKRLNAAYKLVREGAWRMERCGD
jgi:hypothetical protein